MHEVAHLINSTTPRKMTRDHHTHTLLYTVHGKAAYTEGGEDGADGGPDCVVKSMCKSLEEWGERRACKYEP